MAKEYDILRPVAELFMERLPFYPLGSIILLIFRIYYLAKNLWYLLFLALIFQFFIINETEDILFLKVFIFEFDDFLTGRIERF